MPLSLTDVNWLAIVAAAVAAFVVGFLWYGPLFGKRWADAMGLGAMRTAWRSSWPRPSSWC